MQKNAPILITGAGGFIGKNLVAALRQQGYGNLLLFEKADTPDTLRRYARQAAFVYHLAGINRPKDPGEFYAGNAGLTDTLLSFLEEAQNPAPVLVTSSTQAELNNDYGRSKAQAEEAVFAHGQRAGAPVYVFRLPGVFGKWCRPNYNSVVATFCYNAVHGLPLTVRDPGYELPLVYIDDVVRCFIDALGGRAATDRSARPHCLVSPVHTATLGHLAGVIGSFMQNRATREAPLLAPGSLEKKLYSTWLSYLPADQFSYPLPMHCDARGSFTEFLRTPERGQLSVNISKPGVVKGNHWHHSKNEKFLVVSGEAVIRFRQVDSCEVIEYRVSGKRLEVVDIPTGYTHNIENVGETDLVTLMWANEPFDPQAPDTIFLEV
ncbi:NAD-dependent epimerase/dehydratase family protein [Allofournierella sp.]|uniref:polysaccharide biosynthesis C-terminal domain-containing protein n=1 Tax=Allofournierella sp. TaxID=1940256 RepID=UPI003AB1845D